MTYCINIHRVLKSLEQFTFRALITPHENNTHQFMFQSFGVVLVDIVADDFQRQTLSVIKAGKGKVPDVTSDNNIEWRMIITYDDAAADDAVATIHLPKQSLNECVYHDVAPQRVAYFIFFTNSLFYLSNQRKGVTSLIIAARMNCSVNKLLTPISITIVDNTTDEV